MPQFNIQDPQSGKTVTVQGDTAPSQQDAEEIFQQSGVRGQSQQQQPQQNPNNPLSGVPVLGGMVDAAESAGSSLLGGAKNVMQDINQGIVSHMTLPKIQQSEQQGEQASQQAMNIQNPSQRAQALGNANKVLRSTSQAAQNTAQQFSPDVTQNPLARAAKAGIQIGTAAELPGAVKGGINLLGKGAGAISDLVSGAGTQAKTAGSITRLMMKKGAAQAAQAGAASAGSKIGFSDLSSNVLENVGDKQTPGFMSKLYEVLDRINPGSIKSGLPNVPEGVPASYSTQEPMLSAEDALKWRKQLDSEIPSDAWKDIRSANDEVKSKIVVRQELNNLIKTAAPAIKNPDKALGMMAGMRGTIPEALIKGGGKAAALWGIDQLSQRTGPVGRGAIDALSAERLLK